ncbi:MAG: MCP four helix bundle domain-containing protein, partial [Janthinobacterium lividum]
MRDPASKDRRTRRQAQTPQAKAARAVKKGKPSPVEWGRPSPRTLHQRSMTITRRLLLILSVALVALIFVGGFGIRALGSAQDRFEYVQRNTLPSIMSLTAVRRDFSALRLFSLRELIAVTDAEHATLNQSHQAITQQLESEMADYEKEDISDDTDRRMLATDRETLQRYVTLYDMMVAKARGGDREGAMQMAVGDGELVAAGNVAQKAVNDHVMYNVKLSEGVRQQNKRAYTTTLTILSVVVALAVLVAIGLALQLYRIISRGLNDLRKTLEDVSGSLDLTRTAPVTRMDEIGHTSVAFNTLLSRVAEVVGEVRQSSGSVAVASREIAAGNIDLSARTEEQAAS